MTEKVKMERDGELKEQWNGMRLGGGRGMMQFVQVRERLALERKKGILLPLKHRGRR